VELNPSPQLLLVHDGQSLLADYSTFFAENGWKYDCISDFSNALKAACDKDYEIIITDLDLPGMSGQAFLDGVRNQKPNQAVMVVSSPTKSEEAIRALRSGAVDFLQKPIDQRFLHETIVRIVNCLRQEEAQYRLLKSMTNYSASYLFTTKALGSYTFIPPILGVLYQAGIISLNTKLKIALAVQEALANSIEHGNLELESKLKDQFDASGKDQFTLTKQQRLLDPAYADRELKVDTLYCDGELSITIKDYGKGFNAPAGGEVKFDEASLLCHGRGLRIIFGSMDKVMYQDGGTKITISKKIL